MDTVNVHTCGITFTAPVACPFVLLWCEKLSLSVSCFCTMVLGIQKQLLRLLSTFALFYLGFSMNCSHTIDKGRWSLDIVCSDVVPKNSQNKYECFIRADSNYFKEDVKADVSFGAFPVSSSSRMVKLNCSTRINLPNSTGSYTYKVFFGTAWVSGKEIFELRIDDPGESILRDCPTLVREGDNVMCQCSSQHHGFPSPTLSWPGQTDSPNLELHDVRLELNMTRYTCEMTWGMKVKTVYYTFIVTPDSERKHMETTPSSTIVIVSVAVAVGLIIIIMITVIVIIIIRRKSLEGDGELEQQRSKHT